MRIRNDLIRATYFKSMYFYFIKELFKISSITAVLIYFTSTNSYHNLMLSVIYLWGKDLIELAVKN